MTTTADPSWQSALADADYHEFAINGVTVNNTRISRSTGPPVGTFSFTMLGSQIDGRHLILQYCEGNNVSNQEIDRVFFFDIILVFY